jgi:hypothetical protein
MGEAMTGWDRVIAAHLRRRSFDALEAAAIYDALAGERKSGAAAVFRRLARRCRMIALRDRWQASQHDPVLVDAATVAAARAARPRRCASCNQPKQEKSVLCSACSQDRRYCHDCRAVRPLDHFWGAARRCRACYRATRPRKDKAQAQANRLATALIAARANRKRALQRYQTLKAAIEARGGLPSRVPASFWQEVGAPLRLSAEGARKLYARMSKRVTP